MTEAWKIKNLNADYFLVAFDISPVNQQLLGLLYSEENTSKTCYWVTWFQFVLIIQFLSFFLKKLPTLIIFSWFSPLHLSYL